MGAKIYVKVKMLAQNIPASQRIDETSSFLPFDTLLACLHIILFHLLAHALCRRFYSCYRERHPALNVQFSNLFEMDARVSRPRDRKMM